MQLHTEIGVFELKDEDILLNEEPILPGESHPYRMRLWVIGNEYGAIVALWATCEQNALDAMLDLNYETFLVRPEDVEDGQEYTYLGNASEPCNLDYAWIEHVKLDKERDFRLCIAFAEARAQGDSHIKASGCARES